MNSAASSWIYSPQKDTLIFLSGLWLTVAVYIYYLGFQTAPYWIPEILTLLFWGGHLVSPIILAWSNEEFRQHMRKYPGYYIYLPVLITVFTVTTMSLMDPMLRLLIFLVFVAWNLWHFASQHFGVFSLYRMRSKMYKPALRHLDRLFPLAVIFLLMPLAWWSAGAEERLGPLVVFFPIQRQVVVISTLSFFALAIYLLAIWRIGGLSVPRAGYALSIAIQPIFTSLSYAHYQLVVFAVCHWIISLGLASEVMARRESKTSTLPYWGIYFVFSLVTYLIFLEEGMLDQFASLFGAVFSYEKYLAYQPGYQHPALGILSGLYFSFNFIHFMYDRFVYAFRQPVVRNTVAPYLMEQN